MWTGFETSPTSTPGEWGSIKLNPGDFISSWILDPNDAIEFYDEPTLVRLLLRLTGVIAIPAANSANAWEAHVFAGIMTYKYDSLPTPYINVDDPTKDWIWWSSLGFYHGANEYGTIFSMPAEGGPQIGAYDIRAKRKIPEGHGLLMVITNFDTGLAEASPIRFYIGGRYLLLNH